MRCYTGTWTHDSASHPDRMAYEVDEDRVVVRQIDHYKDERVERSSLGMDGMADQPFDPAEFEPLDPSMTLTEISAAHFQKLWNDGRS